MFPARPEGVNPVGTRAGGRVTGANSSRAWEPVARCGMAPDAVWMDRWVIPPAVVAAVAAVFAVAPPVGDARARTGWRVEGFAVRRGAVETLLLRATLDDRAAERYWLPPTVRWTLLDERGAARFSEETRADPGAVWGYLSRIDARGVARVRVEAEGIRAEVAVPRAGVIPAETPARGADLLATVLEGTLLPGVEGTAALSSRGEVAEWRVEPAMDNTHTGSEVKTRNLALVRMQVDGMGAPINVVRRGFDNSVRRDVVRLPVSSVGVAVLAPLPSFAPPESVTLRAAVGASRVHAVWGDDDGPCGWTSLRTAGEREGAAATLTFPEPERCAPTWIEATTDGTFHERAGRRLAGARERLRAYGHSDIFATWPSPPAPPVLFDGALHAERAHLVRVRGARRLALGTLFAAVLLEVAMVLGAGVRRGPAALAGVENAPRTRAGMVAAAAALILAGGLVMGLSALLHR